jgi:hypothetical protein
MKTHETVADVLTDFRALLGSERWLAREALHCDTLKILSRIEAAMSQGEPVAFVRPSDLRNLHESKKLGISMASILARFESEAGWDAALYTRPAQPAAGPVESTYPKPPASLYPGCSGDPVSCPENEGYGCCGQNTPPDGFDVEAIYSAYKTWPNDIRQKLSLDDLRRMNGWTPPNPTAPPAPVVPDGYSLVPSKMHVSPEQWNAAQFAFGGPGSNEGEPFYDCTLWVGKIENDDGSKTNGLHVSCNECPEEGSITLSEFTTPSPTTKKDDDNG